MKYKYITLIILAATISGCGKKEEQQAGGPPDFPVSAVLAKAAAQPMTDSIEVVGSLIARDMVTIISELDSTIKETKVKEGQLVRKGDVLFVLDDVRTGALLAQAKAGLKLAQLSYDRKKGLLAENAVSKQALDEALADLDSKKAQLDLAAHEQSKTVIKAPFDGMVGEKQASSGQFISRGRQLAQIVRTDPLDITANIPERYIAKLANGLELNFATDAYEGETFTAKMVYISPTVDEASRTVRIKAALSNAEGKLRPGMFGSLSLIMASRDDALLIPESCIQMQGPAKLVLRVNGESRVEMTPVVTGSRSKGMVEILQGLAADDVVVVEGWQKMGPGSLVMAAPESEKYGVTPAAPEPAPAAAEETTDEV